MSATVVTIRGGKCHRRRNCQQDANTISARRLLTTMERCAFADTSRETLDERANALAFSWMLEGKLPRNNLRLIAGTLDIRRDFEVRLAEKEVARAQHEAFAAKIRRTRALYGKDAAEAMYADSERLWERHWQATLDLANTPVFTRSDLKRKRAAIGGVWLSAEGERFDQLRAAVAADEARLGERKEA